jgi:CBS domain-containing membrane protein
MVKRHRESKRRPPQDDVAALHPTSLLRRYPPRAVRAGYVFATSFLTLGLLALVAMLSGTPLVFPSLGPTAFMLFHDSRSASASPRNTIVGHAIGIVCGYGALWLTGLADDPPTMIEQLNLARVLCAALALGATGLGMVALNVWHPPAGATTLIVALGFITLPYHLLIVELAVVLLVVLAIGINRLAGIETKASH